jgi:hypothetical protein
VTERILTTLVHELRRLGGRWWMAMVCIGTAARRAENR